MADDCNLHPVYDRSPSNSHSPSHRLNNSILRRLFLEQTAVQGSNAWILEAPSLQEVPNASGCTDSSNSDSVEVIEVLENSLNTETCESQISAIATEQTTEFPLALDCISPSPVPKLKINSSFSLNAMHDVFVHFNAEKRALIESIGMGGLLKVHKQRLQCRDLLFFLLSNMDPTSGTITLKSGLLPIKDRDVNLVLDIPHCGEQVKICNPSLAVIDKVKAILFIPSDNDITIEAVEAILLKDYGRKMNRPQRDAFKVAATLFVDSCFLGPRGSKRKLNKDLLHNVVDPLKISKMNWSSYVLKILRQSASKVQHNLKVHNKTVLLEGCLIFLLVFYLDNLNFGYMSPRHDIFPRIAKYTPRLVSELVSYDRVITGTRRTSVYGRSKLRTSGDVIYSRHLCTPRVKSVHGQMSTKTKFSSVTPVSSSAKHFVEKKDEDHLSISEVQDAFDAYLELFRNQIQQCTEELELKIHTMLNKFYDGGSSSSQAPKANRDVIEGSKQSSQIISNYGLKAQSRKFHKTVRSSSSSSSRDDAISGSCNLHPDNMLKCSLPVVAIQGCTSHNLSASKTVFDGETDGNNSGDHYKFDPSSMFLALKHRDIPLRNILQVIRVLPKLSCEEKNEYWYIHYLPSKLCIKGENLYQAFFKETDFSQDIMSAVMRLYNEQDDEFFKQTHENLWRHYLAPDWAKHALMDVEDKEISQFSINKFFVSKAARCSLVIVPVYVGLSWALYCWDFIAYTISILDPVTNDINVLHENHDAIISRLHNAILCCKQQYVDCSAASKRKWCRRYVTEKDECSFLSNSGLYCAFYARFFDGSTCTRTMALEDSVTIFQTTLLLEVLRSDANQGSYPQSIRDCMDHIV